ncbi:hypothetical protein Tco_0393904 [Tanacetum coccineum]
MAYAIASKEVNIDGKFYQRRYTTYQEPLKDNSVPKESNSSMQNVSNQPTEKSSFASVLNEKPLKKIVKIKEMRSVERVNGAAVALPLAAVEAVNARFTNTLYGYFIGNRLAFPLVENYVKNAWAKYGLKRIQMHEEFFLFQFNTREGMESVMENGPWLIRLVPLILNEWTPNTILKKDEIKCAHVWEHLCKSLIGNLGFEKEIQCQWLIAIPLSNKVGHTFATIDIEYEWTPPRCATCKVFDHVDEKCPKLPKVDPPNQVVDDGFTEVKRKKKVKSKQAAKRQVEGVWLSKPPLNLQYRRVENGESSKNKAPIVKEPSMPSVDVSCGEGLKTRNMVTCINTANSFSALRRRSASTWEDNDGTSLKADLNIINDSDSEEVDEYITIHEKTVHSLKRYIHWRSLWNGLCLHKNYVRNRPWCLRVDFNASLFVGDTSMGSSRVMANLEFNDAFVGAHAIFQPYRISDHSPSALSIPTLVIAKPRPFKFFNVLTLNARFMDVVRDEWTRRISGFHMFQVVKKLKCLKKPIRKLMYEKGNLHDNVIRLRAELDRLQTALDMDPSNVRLREDEAGAVLAFNEALIIEEKFLKQKAKIEWLKDGDSNSAYFHKAVKSRISRSRIDVITDATGFNVDNLFSMCLSANEALDMIRPVSSKEVKEAMFSMGNDKSPGQVGVIRLPSSKVLGILLVRMWFLLALAFITAWFLGLWSVFPLPLSRSASMGLFMVTLRGRGDSSAMVIKEALDEFKDASGLTPISMWFDSGVNASPLSSIISSRDIFRAGWNLSTKVRDLIHDGMWNWPIEWFHKYPLLCTIPVPAIRHDKSDYLEWRDSDGVGKTSYTLRSLSCMKRLKTQDMLSHWDVVAGLPLVCPLCEAQPDSHDHLFFECSFSSQIWMHMKRFAGLLNSGSSLVSIMSHLLPIAKRKSSKSTIGKLVVAAVAYFIWQERNRRLFKKSKRSAKEKSRDGVMFAHLWELPSTCFK